MSSAPQDPRRGDPSGVQIFTDGSCRPNPGPMGLGWIIAVEGKIVVSKMKLVRGPKGGISNGTSQRAELLAACEALKALKGLKLDHPVRAYADSSYVVNLARRTWKAKENKQLVERLRQLTDARGATWYWVRGHADDEMNKAVDKLAYKALEHVPKHTPSRIEQRGKDHNRVPDLGDEDEWVSIGGKRYVQRLLVCPVCEEQMYLKPSRFGLFYSCNNWSECETAHGAHPDGRPLGRPADPNTKRARIEAHAVFDEIWKSGKKKRGGAYAWMREAMEMSKHDAHISRFDLEQCERLVELVYRDFPELF